jgi:hypothetical protein
METCGRARHAWEIAVKPRDLHRESARSRLHLGDCRRRPGAAAACSTDAVSGSAGKNDSMASSSRVMSSGVPKVATMLNKVSSWPLLAAQPVQQVRLPLAEVDDAGCHAT